MSVESVPYSARIVPHLPDMPTDRASAPRRRNGGRPAPPTSPRGNSRRNPRFGGGPKSARSHVKAMSPVVANAPTSPADASERFSSFLTPYEQAEIFDFSDIYYVGKRSSKINIDPRVQDSESFDDETNNYNLSIGDHLAYRFEIVALFGAGAFGQVARCFDHKTRQSVAVKVIVNTEQMHEQGRVEAQILSQLCGRDQRHIVRAFDYFVFRSHICITFEILGMNLFELCEVNKFQPLPARLVRMYALQMLSALDQLHKIGAVHCDIKPENVLLVAGSNALVKIIDFGSGCFDGHQIYEYIQSRFYRAPEVVLGIPYGPPMDVWSVALVIVELLLGRPLFPGDDEPEQLAMIAELLGPVPEQMLDQAKRRDEFFTEDNEMLNATVTAVRVPGTMNLKEILETNDDYLIDFLMKLLTWDPDARATASQAMQHPWIRMKEIRPGGGRVNKNLPTLNSRKRRRY